MKDRGVMCVKYSKSGLKEVSEDKGQSLDGFMQRQGTESLTPAVTSAFKVCRSKADS